MADLLELVGSFRAVGILVGMVFLWDECISNCSVKIVQCEARLHAAEDPSAILDRTSSSRSGNFRAHHGQLAVGLLDLGLRSAGLNLENIVKMGLGALRRHVERSVCWVLGYEAGVIDER